MKDETLMPVHIVNYDLNAPGQNYKNLIEELQRVGAIRYQKSAWLIDNSQSAAQLRDAIMTYLDENDNVFVAEIAPDADWAAYNLTRASGLWLKARRP